MSASFASIHSLISFTRKNSSIPTAYHLSREHGHHALQFSLWIVVCKADPIRALTALWRFRSPSSAYERWIYHLFCPRQLERGSPHPTVNCSPFAVSPFPTCLHLTCRRRLLLSCHFESRRWYPPVRSRSATIVPKRLASGPQLSNIDSELTIARPSWLHYWCARPSCCPSNDHCLRSHSTRWPPTCFPNGLLLRPSASTTHRLEPSPPAHSSTFCYVAGASTTTAISVANSSIKMTIISFIYYRFSNWHSNN